ncbi:MAG: hypothetical protein OXC63_08470 [Aestuariivita sp.]|nr:hypothetical protein [Aestuariivita sp.]MCY4345425.1 hypothetical protein [Aestuariivita sp.]
MPTLDVVFGRQISVPVWSLVLIAVLGLATVAVNAAVGNGVIIGNATPSVPRGVYLRSTPEDASYVSFCLAQSHRMMISYGDYCRPEQPMATRILKRIERTLPDGRLIVRGNTQKSLDSRLLGPVDPESIQGWWRPLLVIDPIVTANNGAGRDRFGRQ